MLSPEMLGLDEEINVFELTSDEKKKEFVPEFDPHDFLETYRSQIEDAIERQELNLEGLYYLRLLGFEGKRERQDEAIETLVEAIKATRRPKDRNRPMGLLGSTELNMMLRVLKPESNSYGYGHYLKMERREFENESHGSRPMYDISMLAASKSPDLVEELEHKLNISGMLEDTVSSTRSKAGKSELDLDYFMNNLVALKVVFPKKMPNIGIDEWEDFKQMFRENAEHDWLEGIRIASNLYILAAEKVEFTENGLIITPRKHSELLDVEIPEVPQIRRF